MKDNTGDRMVSDLYLRKIGSGWAVGPMETNRTFLTLVQGTGYEYGIGFGGPQCIRRIPFCAVLPVTVPLWNGVEAKTSYKRH